MGKSYYDYIKEISPEEIYEGLLGYGLFNEKIVPFLTSKNFYDYCKHKNNIGASSKRKEYVTFECMRNINIPRILGIPDPFLYEQLCKEIKDGWKEIQSYFKDKTKEDRHKVSRIHIRKQKNSKSLFRMNYGNQNITNELNLYLLSNNKYKVKADISTCFPSMYTHAISWALYGKSTAKSLQDNRNGKNKDYKLADVLDKRVRAMKNNETHGFLIGPYTSNVLSEIILTAVDKKLYKSWKSYYRCIDDYTCYVESYEDAQKFLLDLQEALREYDLLLNFKKTEICKLPIPLEEEWIRNLSVYLNSIIQGKNLSSIQVCRFLDFIVDLMRKNEENAAILNYGIKALSRQRMTLSAKRDYFRYICHLALLYPYIVPLLDEYVLQAFKINKKLIKDLSHNIYTSNFTSRNFEGACYAIYFSLKYSFEIELTNEKISMDSILNSNSCLLKLLVYLYYKCHNDREKLRMIKEYVKKLSENKSDFQQNWVLVYEVLSQNELKDEWKKLKEAKVSFVKEEYRFTNKSKSRR